MNIDKFVSALCECYKTLHAVALRHLGHNVWYLSSGCCDKNTIDKVA